MDEILALPKVQQHVQQLRNLNPDYLIDEKFISPVKKEEIDFRSSSPTEECSFTFVGRNISEMDSNRECPQTLQNIKDNDKKIASIIKVSRPYKTSR
jgi:hypothetical protein